MFYSAAKVSRLWADVATFPPIRNGCCLVQSLRERVALFADEHFVGKIVANKRFILRIPLGDSASARCWEQTNHGVRKGDKELPKHVRFLRVHVVRREI